MVLGFLNKGVTYPKCMYDCACAYGFAYHPGALGIELGGCSASDEEWLGMLYGVSFERVYGIEMDDKDEAWQDYLDRIWDCLQEGLPVVTCRGWRARETGDEIVSPSGMRTFWWEGLSQKNRPDTHFFVVIGLDKSENMLYMNDPAWGWFGSGKGSTVPLRQFRPAVEMQKPDHRYQTIVYRKSGEPPKGGNEVDRLVKDRIRKKVEGDSSVYDKPAKHYCLYGVEGWRAFRNDLDPDRFTRILALRKERQGFKPVEVLAWMRLKLYHHHFMALISADYLEPLQRVKDWEWLVNLEILYRRLYVSNEELIANFRSASDVKSAVAKSRPVLKEMQGLIDEVIEHARHLP